MTGTFLEPCWDGVYFVKLSLPFGSHSFIFIFITFADALAWILCVKHAVTTFLHYLDDFFTCHRPNSNECACNIEAIHTVFDDLGVPLAFDKLIGMHSVSWHQDSIEKVVKMPADKLFELMSKLDFWGNHQKCAKRKLLSLIGKLCFTAKVVQPGRIFLHCVIDLSTSVTELHHHECVSHIRHCLVTELLAFKEWKSLIPKCEWI